MATRPTMRSCSLAAGALMLALAALPARAADPILMFVLGFAKNVIESNLEANAKKPAPLPLNPLPPLPAIAYKAPSMMTSEDLRALVEDSFAYLDRAQRTELLTGLEKALSDPALAAHREALLGEFVAVARQVGFTHRQLDRLSGAQKRALAEQFVANYRSLSATEQQALMQQLRQRALPLPSDLNEMMLTTLAATP